MEHTKSWLICQFFPRGQEATNDSNIIVINDI